MYGKSIAVDLHNCNVSLFNRRDLKKFVKALCVYIDMTPAKLVWWDYGADEQSKAEAPPHLKGVSMVQFIETSTIVIHTLDDLKAAYVDLFSCGGFDGEAAARFMAEYFEGDIVTFNEVVRK